MVKKIYIRGLLSATLIMTGACTDDLINLVSESTLTTTSFFIHRKIWTLLCWVFTAIISHRSSTTSSWNFPEIMFTLENGRLLHR